MNVEYSKDVSMYPSSHPPLIQAITPKIIRPLTLESLPVHSFTGTYNLVTKS